SPYGLALGDFNGDGALDLAVANKNSNNVSVLLHRPPAPYQAHLGPPAFYPVGKEPQAVAVGDFDRDGKRDVVVADYANRTVTTLLGKGDGTFRDAGHCVYRKGPVAVAREDRIDRDHRRLDLAVGDFNPDGRLDLAVVDSRDDAVRVLLGKGDGSFRDAVPYAVGKSPRSVVAGDFNGDGRLDLVVANHDGATVSVLLGKGDGSFREAVAFPAGE